MVKPAVRIIAALPLVCLLGISAGADDKKDKVVLKPGPPPVKAEPAKKPDPSGIPAKEFKDPNRDKGLKIKEPPPPPKK